MIKTFCDACEKESFDGLRYPPKWINVGRRLSLKPPLVLCPACAVAKLGQKLYDAVAPTGTTGAPCGSTIGRHGCQSPDCPCMHVGECVPVYHGGCLKKSRPSDFVLGPDGDPDDELSLGA